jgi:hypothetical protein
MKIPFDIHIKLNIDYNSSNEERYLYTESIEKLLALLDANIVSIGAGPFCDEKVKEFNL